MRGTVGRTRREGHGLRAVWSPRNDAVAACTLWVVAGGVAADRHVFGSSVGAADQDDPESRIVVVCCRHVVSWSVRCALGCWPACAELLTGISTLAVRVRALTVAAARASAAWTVAAGRRDEVG